MVFGFSLRKGYIKIASPPTIINNLDMVSRTASQVHSHYRDPSGEMNPLGNITKEVMVVALHIKGVSTLKKVYDNLYVLCKRTVESDALQLLH